MKIILTLLLFATSTIGAELAPAKSPRVIEIEQKFHLEFQKLASADDNFWWVFLASPINPVVVHVDAPDSEVEACVETSVTSARLFHDYLAALVKKAQGKK